MKTLEALQRDMETTGDLQGIVRTMKVLAAVSIRQYEKAQESLQQYNRSIELGLQAVLQNQPATNNHFKKKNAPIFGAVIFGSDHGLCGRYNESITKFSIQQMDEISQQPQLRRILVVGDRVAASLRDLGQVVEDCFWVPGAVGNISDTVQKILLKIDAWQQDGIEYIMLFHHGRMQKTNYLPQAKQLLPVDDLNRFNKTSKKTWPSRSLPQYSLPTQELLSSLIRQRLFIHLFSACAESLAGEHASRLMSMQMAEKNIQQRLESLTALYRQQRQDQITEELLDVVSGFEVMQDNHS